MVIWLSRDNNQFLHEQQPPPAAAKTVIVEEMVKPIRHPALLIHT